MSTAAPPADWHRLDPRTVLVTALVVAGVVAGAAIPVTLGLTRWFSLPVAVLQVLAGAVLVIGVAAGADRVRWHRTRYRIGTERVDLHTGLLLVKRRSLARSRIRTVDLTANLMLRLLGLVTVRIGTGEQGSESTLVLDPVTRAEGERLRLLLLERAVTASPGVHREGELAVLDP
ncbi:PH domain-containing protein, partial [Streptomyces sp. SID4931]